MALSRTTSKHNLKIYRPVEEEIEEDNMIINTVYKEVLKCTSNCKTCASKTKK